MTYQLPQQDLQLKQNQFLLLNPYDSHKQLYVQNKKFLIELNPSLIKQVSSSLSGHSHEIFFAQTPQQSPLITKWVAFILDYLQTVDRAQDTSMSLFLDNCFTQLSILLINSSMHSSHYTIDTSQPHHPGLMKTIYALKESYTLDWNLDDIAQIAMMDKFTFSHSFKDNFGVSPYSWLQLYRLQRSLELLKFSNQSILSIAVTCGFSSISLYNRLFKRVYQMTPSRFRKFFTT